jgi:signal transduction histidine kinase
MIMEYALGQIRLNNLRNIKQRSMSMAIQPIELLQRAFPALDELELDHLAGLATLKTYPPDTILCHEGAFEHTFYLISSGGVVITKRFDEHGDLVLRNGGPGEFFGEMAIIQDAPRSATVTTTEETTVLEIDKQVMETALSANASLALTMIRTTFDRLRANDIMTIRELREAFETLERLDRAKLDFIQVAAHELRTPLTVMRGYASMLLAEPAIRDNAMLNEITQGVVNGSTRLHEIVNNMLDVQKIDMDTLEAAAIPVSLPVVLRGIIVSFKQAIEERQINLEMNVEAEDDLMYIEADPGLVNKALYHLVMNAIKYTPDGGTIRISCYYEDVEELGRSAHIAISDTGIGIAPEHQKLIFEKFYRLGEVALHSSGKTAFKAGGPGLGLAIARGAINAHGGRIWIDSPGYSEELLPGSTFHVLLPVQARKRPHQHENANMPPNIKLTHQ